MLFSKVLQSPLFFLFLKFISALLPSFLLSQYLLLLRPPHSPALPVPSLSSLSASGFSPLPLALSLVELFSWSRSLINLRIFHPSISPLSRYPPCPSSIPRIKPLNMSPQDSFRHLGTFPPPNSILSFHQPVVPSRGFWRPQPWPRSRSRPRPVLRRPLEPGSEGPLRWAPLELRDADRDTRFTIARETKLGSVRLSCCSGCQQRFSPLLGDGEEMTSRKRRRSRLRVRGWGGSPGGSSARTCLTPPGRRRRTLGTVAPRAPLGFTWARGAVGPRSGEGIGRVTRSCRPSFIP